MGSINRIIINNMQGDSVMVDGFAYEAIDEQRSKCVTCQKIIYKLLQRAHSNSHALLKPVVSSSTDTLPKNVIKGVKKISLQLDNRDIISEAKLKSLTPPCENQVELLEVNGSPYHNHLQLPKKSLQRNLSDPLKRRPKSSDFLKCILKLKEVRAAFNKLSKVQKRSNFIVSLKSFRKWKKAYVN